MEFLFSQIAFLGNFHPVMVHFPLALLPVALLLKLSGRAYLEDAAELLLKLVLLTAVLAACMGLLNSKANGFSGAALDSHALMAWSTIAVLFVAVYLPRDFKNSTLLQLFSATGSTLGKSLFWLLKKIGLVLKYSLRVLLFPLWFLYLLSKKIYQRFLAQTLSPVFGKIGSGISQFYKRMAAFCRRFAERLFTLPNMRATASVLALFMIMVTGYRGSNLVHGEGHLAHHAPEWLQPVFGAAEQQDLSAKLDQPFYEKHVQPLLQKNCVKCHGADKQKGNLQLHDFAVISQSNVIDFKSPYNSELIKRVLVARDDPQAMPPAKHGKALSGEDLAHLLDWVNGATLASVGGDEIKNTLADYYLAIDRQLRPLDNDKLAIAIDGVKLTRLSEGHQLLAANLQFVAQQDMKKAWQLLQPIKQHIVQLNVSMRPVEAWEQVEISSMNNLVKLDLSNTQLQQTEFLKQQSNLRWLNVFGNNLSEAKIETLEKLPNLEVFYHGMPQAISSLP